MEDKGSIKVVELFHKANKNKNDIALKNDNGRDFSKAEMTVLSCLAVLAREAEYSKMPGLKSEVDYNKVIKTLILNSLDGMTDGLKKKEEYDKIINSYKNMELYDAYAATCVYKGMTDNFYTYLEPVYKEEVFVNDHLPLQEKEVEFHNFYGFNGERAESYLEHIYGSLVLAVGLESEYNYDIDYNKLYKMLLVSLTPEEVMNKLYGGKNLVSLKKEYDSFTSSLESEYAFLLSSLQDDMQAKVYDDNDMYDIKNRFNYFNEAQFYNKKIPCLGRILRSAADYKFTKEEIKMPERRAIPRLKK